jgi:hypothetical protein
MCGVSQSNSFVSLRCDWTRCTAYMRSLRRNGRDHRGVYLLDLLDCSLDLRSKHRAVRIHPVSRDADMVSRDGGAGGFRSASRARAGDRVGIYAAKPYSKTNLQGVTVLFCLSKNDACS